MLFTIAGVCVPKAHYMLPPLPRLPEVRDLIDRQLYFVLHAPRQSGKSTSPPLAEADHARLAAVVDAP